MNRKILIIITVCALQIPFSALAQFSLEAQLRTRGEINHGYKFIPDTSSHTQYYVAQRTRLTANFKQDHLSFRLSIQDVRAWGGEDNYTPTGVLGDESGLDVYESWAELKVSEYFFMRLGRQILRYDDQRLLGVNDWNPYAISYDALLLKYHRKGWTMDAGFSWNSLHDKVLGTNEFDNSYYSDKNRIRMLEFLYLKKNFSPRFSASWLSVITGYQKPGTRNTIYALATTGLYAYYNSDVLSAKAYGYYQFGKNSTGMDVKAWMACLTGEAKFNKLSLGAGLDILSGQDGSNADPEYQKVDHGFDILYGGRFIFNGWMNQFVNLKPATRNGGLVDFYPNATYHFNEKSKLQMVWHLFHLQNKVTVTGSSVPGFYPKALGTEYDLMFTRRFNKDLELKAGFSYFNTSLTMEALKGVTGKADPAYWGWIMVHISPELFRN